MIRCLDPLCKRAASHKVSTQKHEKTAETRWDLLGEPLGLLGLESCGRGSNSPHEFLCGSLRHPILKYLDR